MPEVRGNNFIQSAVTVKVQVISPALKVHREDQAHEPQIMIAVQVTDENMVDTMKVYLEMHELHLHTFTAVDQEVLILNFHELRRRESPIGRQCTAGTQYRDLEIHT